MIAFVYIRIVAISVMNYSREVLVRKYRRGYVIASFRILLTL